MSRPVGLRPRPSPPVITAASRCALGGRLRTLNVGASASGASPWSGGADVVLAFPFVIEATTAFYKGFWLNGSGTIGGTRDIAIFDESYNLIVGTGAATSATGTSVPQSVAFTATTTLPPGLYYAGMDCSVTTTGNQFRWSVATIGNSLWASLGCWKSGADANPISVNPAVPVEYTNIAFPLFGVITRSVFDV